MPQSPNVLVAVGQGSRGYIPQQSYSNLFTEFNTDVGAFSSFDNDANFYNTKIRTPSTQGKSDFDIYGFMPNNYEYTTDSSVQTIVDFFQQDPNINLVVCDILNLYPQFTTYNYVHPNNTNNIPFFIRQNLVDQIGFVNESLLLQEQLHRLKQNNIIFHIAKPLISLHHTP